MTFFESSGRHTSTPRVVLFLSGVGLSAVLVTYNLFVLTYVKHADYVDTARLQYVNPSAGLSGRGNIYLSNAIAGERILASSNIKKPYLYSNNSKIKYPESIVARLSEILGVEREIIETKMAEKTNYQIITRTMTKEQAAEVENLHEPGLIVGWEISRYYPQGSLGSHMLGFVGYDGNNRIGQYGVESWYDKALYGEDIVLTIDKNIQSFIELKLRNLVDQYSASGGTIIIQEPTTGAILAMASVPTFNSNEYWESGLEDFANPAVQKLFEPGSSFKSITMAAALDSKSVTPTSTYNDTGAVKIGEYTIMNSDKLAHGIQTMTEVLMYSLNTGSIHAQKQTGNDAFLNYLVQFGFGEKTGIDLAGELSGNISNLYSDRKINFYTASFGQGIAVTPIQLVNSYSAIANGGKLMRPYVVKEIVHANGSKDTTEPEVIDVPIREKTATQLQSMLATVVSEHYTSLRIKGYDIAAKTGTAQIADVSGGYNENDVIHNVLGFAPAYSAKFTILIKIDKPVGVKFAERSISPTFAEVTNFLLHYFNIPPTN